jgi:dTDP-4-dehydrorhamnose reductase
MFIVRRKGETEMYLIIGASGFIGKHLYEYCKKNQVNVLGTYHTHADNPEWIRFDICSDDLRTFCHTYLQDYVPEAVIVCGANASIDSCKRNEAESNRLNVEGTKRILAQADEMSIKSVFLSSEAVFDGRKGMYSEEDEPNPITLYGSQKLQIEQYLVQNVKDYLILRISRATGSSFGEKDIWGEFYNKIVNKEDIICLKNQSFCLTEVDDIAQCIVMSLRKNIKGVYHLSSPNYISRYELAKLYANKIFGGYDRIYEKEYGEIPFLDNRHIFGGLNGEKLENIIGFKFKNIKEMLNTYCESQIIRKIEKH